MAESHVNDELPMPELPPDVAPYKETKEFDEYTVPAGLTRSHRTKAGVWGEIVVTAGHLVYVLETEPEQRSSLNPSVNGVAAPEQPHRVIVPPGGRFFVRFHR
jgi:tellurite resistance-related uncharacterized protein